MSATYIANESFSMKSDWLEAKDQRVDNVNRNLQTGITVNDNESHHENNRAQAAGERTIDCNGDTLGQGIAIGTNKRGNPCEWIDLQVFGRNAFRGLSVDNFEVELVGLGSCSNRNGPYIALIV